MKNILYKFLPIALFFGIVLSCKEESNLPSGIQTGVNARVITAYADNSFVNLADIANAAVKFDIYSKNSDLLKLEYSVSMTKFSTGQTSAPVLMKTVNGSDFSGGKATVTITAADMATALGLPGGTADIAGGDAFNYTTKAYMTDGRTFDASNIAPSIAQSGTSSFTSKFVFFAGCPSDQSKITGAYVSTVDYNDAGEPTGVPHDVTITFQGPEPFRYHVTDHTGLLYAPYGGKAYPADFYDICGTPILLPTVSFGSVVNYFPAAGEVPPFSNPIIDESTANTVIIFTWHETFNDIKATMKFVKK